jgi:hypothetical protein
MSRVPFVSLEPLPRGGPAIGAIVLLARGRTFARRASMLCHQAGVRG